MSATVQKQDKRLNLIQDSDNDSGVVQSQIRKVPSDTYMWLAAGSIIASLTLKFMNRDKDSLFVGQWAPTFAILGVFDKILRSK
jgi:hypothetical protein